MRVHSIWKYPVAEARGIQMRQAYLGKMGIPGDCDLAFLPYYDPDCSDYEFDDELFRVSSELLGECRVVDHPPTVIEYRGVRYTPRELLNFLPEGKWILHPEKPSVEIVLRSSLEAVAEKLGNTPDLGANIYIAGGEPFSEQRMREIHIGSAVLAVGSPISYSSYYERRIVEAIDELNGGFLGVTAEVYQAGMVREGDDALVEFSPAVSCLREISEDELPF